MHFLLFVLTTLMTNVYAPRTGPRCVLEDSIYPATVKNSFAIICSNIIDGGQSLQELISNPTTSDNISVTGNHSARNFTHVTTIIINGGSFTINETGLQPFGNLKKLSMANLKEPGKLSFIHPRALAGIKDLQRLTVEGFNLTGNTLDSFRPLQESLKSLSLYNCPMQRLHQALSQFKTLNIVKLIDCDLVELPENMFSSSASTLKYLAINSNNITVIRANTFRDHTELTSMDMVRNNIVELENGAFDGVPNLEYLDLRHNKIEHLPVNFLKRNTKIYWLNLAGNPVRNISNDTFSYLPKLQHVVLPEFEDDDKL